MLIRTASAAVPVLSILARMDLDAYVAEHAAQWRRLEHLSSKRRLGAPEVDELISLYQRTGTHLSVILLQAWRWWTAVGVGFTALSFLMMYYVAGHPDVQAAFFSDSEIKAIVDSEFASYYSENQAQNFALEVWTHNAYLTGQCLAAGILILPVFYLLAQNLFNLGLIGGVMIGNGRADLFFGLIAPHGLLELTTLYVASGVGLRIGWAWIAPGPGRTRGRALAETARAGMLVALGLVGALAVSGLLEAFVTPSPLPTVARIAIGVVAWLGFLTYVIVLGNRAKEQKLSADLDTELSDDARPMV